MTERSTPVAGPEELTEMAIEGRTGDLAAELNAGASADTVDRRQSSLLMHASAHGNLSTVELLLQHGASVHYVDPQRGRTALGAALYRGQATIVERLLRAGADPQAGQPSARDLAVQWKKADLLP